MRFAETAIGLAEAGIGIAIVDAFSALAADRTKVSVRRLDHPPLYEVYLHRQIERARSRLIEIGAEPAPGTPESLAAFMAKDAETWAGVIKAAGIKAE